MDSRKQDVSRRRTVVSKKSSTENLKKESKSSFVSFFFGGKSVQTTSANESKSGKSDGGGRSPRMGISRANSSASMSSAFSKKSELSLDSSVKGSVQGSVKGSVKGGSPRSQHSVPLSSQSRASEEEEDDLLENKAIEVSLRLQLWESATGKKPSKSSSTKSKRSLNRETSSGSNISNISALTNNSNISILSSSSNGSLVSSVDKSSRPSSTSFKQKKTPFDPAAAAALNRQRVFGDTNAVQEEEIYAVRSATVQPVLVEKTAPARQEQLLQQHQATHSQSTTISTAASQALTEPSSAESSPTSSPVSSPRRLQPPAAQQPLPPVAASAGPETVKLVRNKQILMSPPSSACTVLSPFAGPAQLIAPPSIPKPALKSPVRDGVAKMEALPSRNADIKNTRQSWIMNASNHISPRVVKFSSSTKSMHSLLSQDTRSSQDSKGGRETESGSEVTKNNYRNNVDLLEIEGATLVEEEEIEEVEEIKAEQPVQAQAAVAKKQVELKPQVQSDVPQQQPQQQPSQPQDLSRIPLAELVRRNVAKEYDGLSRQNLEVYLSDEEFKGTFSMKRESFFALPFWRQQSLKRSVGLF